MSRLVTTIVGIGAAVGALAVGRRHRRVAGVAPELRHPVLYLPMSLRGSRSLRRGRRLVGGPSDIADGVEVRTHHVPATAGRPAVRVVTYRRTGGPRPAGALVWMHGGGLVMGTPEQANDRCSRLAAELGIVVVGVDYRLAPEHPFPAGLEDCYAALCWTAAQAVDLGVDVSRIAVGGDSAGGGLAACLAQLALDRGGPPVCFQLLLAPMLDDRTALRRGADALVWTSASNRYAWSAYLGHPVDRRDTRPYAAAARRRELTGLPPAWIGVGDVDLFLSETLDYAGRLRTAEVPCALHVVPGMFHGAEHVAPAAPSIRALLDDMTGALGAALSPSSTAAGEHADAAPPSHRGPQPLAPASVDRPGVAGSVSDP